MGYWDFVLIRFIEVKCERDRLNVYFNRNDYDGWG